MRALLRIKINQFSGCGIRVNQMRRGAERSRVQSCVEGLRKTGIGIVEGQRFHCARSHRKGSVLSAAVLNLSIHGKDKDAFAELHIDIREQT